MEGSALLSPRRICADSICDTPGRRVSPGWSSDVSLGGQSRVVFTLDCFHVGQCRFGLCRREKQQWMDQDESTQPRKRPFFFLALHSNYEEHAQQLAFTGSAWRTTWCCVYFQPARSSRRSLLFLGSRMPTSSAVRTLRARRVSRSTIVLVFF